MISGLYTCVSGVISRISLGLNGLPTVTASAGIPENVRASGGAPLPTGEGGRESRRDEALIGGAGNDTLNSHGKASEITIPWSEASEATDETEFRREVDVREDVRVASSGAGDSGRRKADGGDVIEMAGEGCAIVGAGMDRRGGCGWFFDRGSSHA